MNQGIVLLPFDETDAGADEELAEQGIPSSNPSVDFAHGALRRLEAFRAAWEKCAARIQEIVERLYAPVVHDVEEFILGSRGGDREGEGEGAEIGSLQVEIPTAVLSGPDQATTAYMLWKRLEPRLADQSDRPSADDGALQAPRGFLARLSGKACPNIAAAVRAVVRGLALPIVHCAEQRGGAGVELGSEDVRGLARLYREVFGDVDEVSRPMLVLALEEVEAFDPHVVEDLIGICLEYAAQLPFRFLFTLSTSGSYVQTSIPRDTLTALNLQHFHSPAPEVVSEQLIRGLYFDPAFEPDVMIGSNALRALRELAEVYGTPASGLISALQLMHMYHFYDPRSLLAAPDLADSDHDENYLLGQDDFADYAKAAVANKHEAELSREPDVPLNRRYRSLYLGATEDIETIATEARDAFAEVVRRMRSALAILLAIRDHCRRMGLRVVEPTMGALDIYQAALEGHSRDVVKNAVTLVKRMEFEQLQRLLEILHTTCEAWPQAIRREERDLRQDIVFFKNLAEDEESLAAFGEKLDEYFRARLVKISRLPLYEAFCIDSVVDYAMDLINPSARSGIIASLIQPMTWLEPKLDLAYEDEPEAAQEEEANLAAYPDASILFVRSLEAGKKINLLDWFQSFSMALEGEQELLAKKAEIPKKRGRPKANGKHLNGTHAANGKSAEEEADLREQELQARFVRGVEELEFVGLLKSTTRRTDFAIRTVFEKVD